MSEEEIKTLLSLVSLPPVTFFDVWVKTRIEYKDVAKLVEAARFLGQRAKELKAREETGQEYACFRYGHAGILRSLALTPGLVFAEAALQLEAEPHWIAMRLAHSQEPETLNRLFARQGTEASSREMLACLLQEMVLRDKYSPGSVPDAALFIADLQASGHPLAWLPLNLAPEELEIKGYAAHFTENGNYSPANPFGLWMESARELPPLPAKNPALPRVTFTERGAGAEVDRIYAAVENWGDESNGRTEARVFELSSSVTPEELPADFLEHLSLECRENAAAISLRRVNPGVILELLFAAAANGAAYNYGEGGAYGRLKMWQSLAALVGCMSEANYDAALEWVRACRAWWVFEVTEVIEDIPYWFHRAGWNMGIVVLRPEGDSIALLAATDTD
jgi:hypothetical protein